jgi:vitamin B12 transporter
MSSCISSHPPGHRAAATRVAGAVALTLASFAAHGVAQAAVDPRNTVVVTASRIETPLAEVIAPTVVIDRETIARSGANDAAELLRFHAGFDLGRNGGPGQPTAVFIRGAESNHTLVLIDGVRINPGTIGLPALQNIPPDMIERIEVVKGPRSALWGTDAMGGVINVVTRRGSRDGWSAEAGYGAYDTRKASLNGGFGVGTATDIDFGLSWLDSAGFPTRTLDDTDRGYENLSANLQVRMDVGAAQLALRHWRAAGTSEYSDFFLTPVDQDFESSTTSAELQFPLATAVAARVTVSHLEDRIEQNQTPDYLRTDRDTLDAQADWRVAPAHLLGFGTMVSRENARSESYGDELDAETDMVSVYVQDRIATGPHNALLALGYTDHESAGSAVTWNLEYGYAVTENTSVFALTGSGFRAPDATDRFGFGGNPLLEPERSLNYEAGVRHTLTPRQSLEFSAFQTDIEDLIDFTVLSYDPFEGENRNVAEARIRGVEAAWAFTSASWTARVEAIYQDPRNSADDSRLLRRARESLTLALSRPVGPIVLGLDVLATGDRKDFGFPAPVTLDGYVLANLTALWQVTPSFSLIGRVENLLDEQYELADTFNTPDRGIYMTLRYAPARGTN